MARNGNYQLKNPPHPGGFVCTEIVAPMELSVTDAARALGVTRAATAILWTIGK